MKQDRVGGIIVAAVNLILIIVCAVLYMGKDREKPGFKFEASETVYREEMDMTELLKGVTAYDAVDGDITDRIVIEKITGNPEEGHSVTVFYAVSDKSGNAAKASRVFEAVSDEEKEVGDTSQARRFPEAGIEAELGGQKEDNGGKESGTAQETAEIPAGSPAQTPEASLPAAAASASPAATPEITAAVAADTSTDSRSQEAGTAGGENSAAPVLTLKAAEVRVKAGQGPAWVEIIDVLSDDKDNYETLFRNLSVERYDRNKPGTYQVGVHTEDSDGNSSAVVPFTIIVE